MKKEYNIKLPDGMLVQVTEEVYRAYTPMFGTVIDLPDTKIRINEKVILNDTHIRLCIPLKATDENGVYINLNKEVVLLPYSDNQKFIVIGVVQ